MELPQGGGAIRGIGEKFTFNAQTGTGDLSVPLNCPKSRADWAPDLALSYDSGAGNGVFGTGWSLGSAAISRKTDKGLPRYFDDSRDETERDTFLLAGAEDLVPMDGGEAVQPDGYVVRRYLPRVEGAFARIEWWRHPLQAERSYWRVQSRDNVTSILGLTDVGRIADPEHPERVFSWLVQAVFDDRGNATVYHYKPEDLSGMNSSMTHELHRLSGHTPICNRHLSRVHYGNRLPFHAPADPAAYREKVAQLIASGTGETRRDWIFDVIFDYGDHVNFEQVQPEPKAWDLRKDPFSSHRASFDVRTYRLCRRILFAQHIDLDPNGDAQGYEGITRSLELGYEESAVLTKLTSVKQVSWRKLDDSSYAKAEWPPLTLGYSEAGEMTRHTIPHQDAISAPEGVDGEHYEFADVDGEGIAGILSRREGGWWYAANRGGRFARALPLPKMPVLAGSGRMQLMDLAGDGALDVVMFDGHGASFSERTEAQGWTPPRPLERAAAFDTTDTSVRFMDITGDGRTDIVRVEHETLLYQESRGEEGFGHVHRIAKEMRKWIDARLSFTEVKQSTFLADMSGDGLTDIVSIMPGRVCYLPNLGYGRFGELVIMENAPVFEASNLFDPARLRLIDADGSGSTDIIYLDRGGATLYPNQSGNSFGTARRIPFPVTHQFASVQSTDFFGDGTGCLVWSSSAPHDQGRHFEVVKLTGGIKPHLLTRIVNNLGAETHLSYRSSTQFYLDDLNEGRPWLTKLPFPVHVVDRVETLDRISRNRFVSRYTYHEGFFDGEEREFRGFGMVEQRDTEEIGAIKDLSDTSKNWDTGSYVPPVLTRTWFHTGHWRRDTTLIVAFQKQFWKADDAVAPLDDTIIPENLSVEEEREACRALRGRMIRQEVYAEDKSDKASRPHLVTEQNFTIEVRQHRGGNKHGVFFAHARETIEAHYERATNDPRVKHEMVLKVDEFGNVQQSLAIGYKRRQRPAANGEPAERQLTDKEWQKQNRTLLTFTAASFTNAFDIPTTWRTPMPADVQTFEITDPAWSAATRIEFTDAQQILASWQGITEIIYQTAPGFAVTERRLIEHVRTVYRSDDLKRLLAPNALEPMAHPGETLKLALTTEMLALFADRASEADLLALLRQNASGYREPDGDARFWISSGRTFYSPDTTGDAVGAAAELAFAKTHFFLPHQFRDPFDNKTQVAYDEPVLRIHEVTDAVQNVSRAVCDYRVLQPQLLIDANDNRSAVKFDTRGLVAGTAILGNDPGGEFGDNFNHFNEDLTDAEIADFLANPIDDAPTLLQQATSRIVYDMLRYYLAPEVDKANSPVFAAVLTRDYHFNDLPTGEVWPDHLPCKFSYSDGFGREIQIKARTGPEIGNGNPPPTTSTRWLGSGWTIFNNKGKPVRQYEPFFTTDHRYQFGRTVGVSPILFYDPLDRVVATLRPDHAWEKVVFDAWRRTHWDVNDTVLLNPATDADVKDYFARLPATDWTPTWYAQRSAVPPANASWRVKAEHQAAMLAKEHAATPTDTHFDTLGREFLVVTHNDYEDPRSHTEKVEFAHTRTDFDIEGNRLAVVDAFGRDVMRWHYDLLGHPLLEESMDAGRRWMLTDAAMQPFHRWDERGHHFQQDYDALRRPLRFFVTKPEANATPVCYERFTYGEHPQAPAAANLRGRVWFHRDTAGKTEMKAYDSKGNLLNSASTFCRDYKSTPDWNQPDALESESFESSTTFDALNRPVKMITPEPSLDDLPSEISPRYTVGGQIFSVTARFARPRLLGSKREDFFIVRGIDYNARGQRQLVQYGNNAGGYGLRSTMTYDPLTFRLQSLVTLNKDVGKPNTKHQSLEYVYDPTGNITAIRDTAQQTFYFRNQVVEPDASYTYDALYRLIGATGREQIGQNLPANAWDCHRTSTRGNNCKFTPFNLPHANDVNAMRNYTQSYAYDLVGNIEAMIHKATGGNWTRNYSYDLVPGTTRDKRSNRLMSTTVGSGTESYSYDLHGSMITMPHLPVMETDFRDQLSMIQRQSVTCADDQPLQRGERIFYVYDAQGERVRKVIERNNRRISERRYLGTTEVYREFDLDDDIALERWTLHISDGQRRFAMVESRTRGSDDHERQLIRCQFPNHLGSASLEVEFQPDARIISYEEYHPYGTTAFQATNSSIRSTAKRYRYTGKERDEESGLNYHSARYLACWLGRWTSTDPSDLSGGLNLFAYANSNPVGAIDPNGLASQDPLADTELVAKPEASSSASSASPPSTVSVASKYWEATKDSVGEFGASVLEPFLPTIDQVSTALANPQVQGGLKFVGGAAEALAGAATAETGIGVVALVHGFDVARTGWEQMWTGEASQDILSSTVQGSLQVFGVSNQTAHNWGEATSGALSATLTLGASMASNSSRVLANELSATNNGLTTITHRGSVEGILAKIENGYLPANYPSPNNAVTRLLDHSNAAVWVSEGQPTLSNRIFSGMVGKRGAASITFDVQSSSVLRPDGLLKRWFGGAQRVIEHDIPIPPNATVRLPR
ncbi:MAG: hypothetical protein KDK99_14440 [Verrucomicrobiales bacterium]|nr:hypothetical protein [Verrucomicrobiales bacterium]